MKRFIDEFGQWIRHKIRVILLKQWKKPKKTYKNLNQRNKKLKCNFTDENIYAVANSRLGLYKQANGNTINFILSPKLLAKEKEERPGLINSLEYYLR